MGNFDGVLSISRRSLFPIYPGYFVTNLTGLYPRGVGDEFSRFLLPHPRHQPVPDALGVSRITIQLRQ